MPTLNTPPSKDAFRRLAGSSQTGSQLCSEWNATVDWLLSLHPGAKALLAGDAQFRADYDAVLLATDVPAKRAAMKHYLAALNGHLARLGIHEANT